MKPMGIALNTLAVCLVLGGTSCLWGQAPVPPTAPQKSHGFDFHGKRIEDPWFWLKDKKNPEVIRYIESENSYRESMTRHLKPFEETLFKEMLSHIKQTDLAVPYRDRGYWYYTRTQEGKQYPIHCRKKGSLESSEEILLDVNEIGAGKKFFSARIAGVSDDGNLLAFLSDTTGFREYHISIKDLTTGKLLEDRFVKAAEVEFAGDGKSILYVTEDAAKRAHKLFLHTIGQPRESDRLLFEEKDELYRLGIRRTRDKKYLIQTSASSTTTEQRFTDSTSPGGPWKTVSPRKEGTEYSVDHRDGLFHIRTNLGNATNFQWMTCPVGLTESSQWKPFEPYKPEVFTQSISLFANHAVVSEREKGLPHIRVVKLADQSSSRISFPEPTYSASPGNNPEFDTDSIQVGYTSLVTPGSVYRVDLNTGKRTLLKQTEVPGGFDPANYLSERIEAVAPDGVKVPMSLVYKKGLKKDGSAPILLYAYGSYGATMPPAFSPTRLPLLDRGVVYALAHIRGGSDLGRQWYLDGKLLKKKNTFTDFIACADHLIREKYGSRDRLAIEGASAGGLLIGAVVNMRPDLCKVAHLGVPFVDVISTMLDESLPLTVQEFLEWGNPKEKEAGLYMLSYSPYDNLAKGSYPSILVTTSLNDSQVLFHEPTKYVAKLRTLKTDPRPLFLKCNMDAGHGGASGRYDALKEQAAVYAFLLSEIGLTQ